MIKIGAALRLQASSIHPEVQACLDRTCKELKRAFPKAYKTFKGFQFKRVNHPSYDAWDREVSLPLFGKDKPLAEVDKEENAADSSVLQLGFEGTLIHEFGHHIDHFIRAKGSEDVLTEWQALKKQLSVELGNVSRYAATNLSEWVAEEFLAEMKQKRPPKLIGAINNLMRNL